MQAAEAKRALRAEVRARLKALAPATRALEEELVTAAVQDTPEWRAARTVLLYRSVAPEWSTVGLANAAWRTGKRVLFPRVEGASMTLHAVAGWTGFEPGPLGIPQPPPAGPASPAVAPEEVDLAIVPGVAWDAAGGRLGRGGGHYDRLLPRLRLAWGVGFSVQVVPQLPREAHDQAVQRVWATGLFPLET